MLFPEYKVTQYSRCPLFPPSFLSFFSSQSLSLHYQRHLPTGVQAKSSCHVGIFITITAFTQALRLFHPLPRLPNPRVSLSGGRKGVCAVSDEQRLRDRLREVVYCGGPGRDELGCCTEEMNADEAAGRTSENVSKIHTFVFDSVLVSVCPSLSKNVCLLSVFLFMCLSNCREILKGKVVRYVCDGCYLCLALPPCLFLHRLSFYSLACFSSPSVCLFLSPSHCPLKSQSERSCPLFKPRLVAVPSICLFVTCFISHHCSFISRRLEGERPTHSRRSRMGRLPSENSLQT